MELSEKVSQRLAEHESEQNGQQTSVPKETQTEPDLPPEYCHYRDEGCELAGSCLHCPLPRCVYDRPGGRRRWLKRVRDKEIVRLFTAEGEEVKELAQKFRVSPRTVQRALGRVKNE